MAENFPDGTEKSCTLLRQAYGEPFVSYRATSLDAKGRVQGRMPPGGRVTMRKIEAALKHSSARACRRPSAHASRSLRSPTSFDMAAVGQALHPTALREAQSATLDPGSLTGARSPFPACWSRSGHGRCRTVDQAWRRGLFTLQEIFQRARSCRGIPASGDPCRRPSGTHIEPTRAFAAVIAEPVEVAQAVAHRGLPFVRLPCLDAGESGAAARDTNGECGAEPPSWISHRWWSDAATHYTQAGRREVLSRDLVP